MIYLDSPSCTKIVTILLGSVQCIQRTFLDYTSLFQFSSYLMVTEWRAKRSLMTGVNTERSELWMLRSDGHLETRVLNVRRVMAVDVDVDD